MTNTHISFVVIVTFNPLFRVVISGCSDKNVIVAALRRNINEDVSLLFVWLVG